MRCQWGSLTGTGVVCCRLAISMKDEENDDDKKWPTLRQEFSLLRLLPPAELSCPPGPPHNKKSQTIVVKPRTQGRRK